MKTRKSINDKHGGRSLYVVERKTILGVWAPDDFGKFTSTSHRQALIYEQQAYVAAVIANKRWARKDFRVALYARVEEEQK